ncbi:hypothetical protein IKX64_00810 [Candidatus Saccharibacteria bacterium]|nr:hypothetical protein [Candidatus Saccharibacteria bacterium]
MKVRKFLYSAILILVASIFIIQPTLAISQQQLEEFANNDIMFYDPEDSETFNCYTTSAKTVKETDNESMIWNWFVNANIPGISNNAEVISGIIGNLKQENSSFDPFAWGGYHEDGSERARGIFKAHNSKFKKAVEDVFGSDIWDKKNLDKDTVRRGIEIELEFMTSSDYNWNGSGFPNLLDIPTNKAGEDGAAAYAELFMLVFERPGNYASLEATPSEYRISAFYIQDPGVKAYELIYNKGRTTNHLYLFGNAGGNPRRSYYAREVYRKYANNPVHTTAQTTFSDSDATIIGDSSLNNIENTLKNSLPGADIKTVENMSAATSLISSSRPNVFFYFDLSKETIGEENLVSLLNAYKDKKIYFIINKSFDNTDYYTVNETLIKSKHSSMQSIIIVNRPSEVSNKISELFQEDVVNLCSGSSSSSSDNVIQQYAELGSITGRLNEDSDTIGCAPGTTPVLNINGENYTIPTYYAGKSIKIRLCAVESLKGTVGVASDYTGRTFQKASCNPNGKNITVSTSAGFDFSSDIQRPADNSSVFNSNVSGVYYAFGEYLKEVLGVSRVPVNSSYRSPAFQKIINTVNPWSKDLSCSWYGGSDVGTWGGAGGEKTSNHVSGHALDLNIKTLTNYYNNNQNGFKQLVDSLPYNTKCFYSNTKVTDVPTTGDWNTPIINHFLCNVIPSFHLYFTVSNENWHIQAIEDN